MEKKPNLLEILEYPDPRLKQKSKEIELAAIPPGRFEIEQKYVDLSQDLFHTMRATGHGIGIAAPQVGQFVRMIVVAVRSPLIMINPKIIETSKGKMDSLEGCLSFPDKFVTVRRWKWVKVEWINLKGELVNKKFRELESRCIQHEMDHLDGILMIERK